MRPRKVTDELRAWCEARGYEVTPATRVHYGPPPNANMLDARPVRSPRRRRSGAKAFNPSIYGGIHA